MAQSRAEELIARARQAAASAYARYSHFRVGAALRCGDGSIMTGFNIENRSFGLTVCAERTALFGALAAGKSDFKEIAVVGLDSEVPLPPCGACRQVLTEFMAPDTPVHFSGKDGKIVTVRLGQLLPNDSLHDFEPRS
ncbi:MAG: cytidine deaminase [Spirochaetales bacterium]|nr:cytidine deaminase [Spirochaetales bacterium]